MGRKQRGTIATKELKYAALAAWLQFWLVFLSSASNHQYHGLGTRQALIFSTGAIACSVRDQASTRPDAGGEGFQSAEAELFVELDGSMVYRRDGQSEFVKLEAS